MKLLVTGCAGFIGMHLCRRLAADGHDITGVDSLDSYYDPALKLARLDRLRALKGFRFRQLDITDREALAALFAAGGFESVVHLAAQAGVRHSLEAPFAFIDSNVTGFLGVLEGCRRYPVRHLVYASSSSVYGRNTKVPFSEDDPVVHPSSLYAATKGAGELMAETYGHLFAVPCTGLRFFTVYGPWGRPDMAYFSFAEAIAQGRPIDVFNQGRMQRDFTYIDDVVEGVVRVLAMPPGQPRILNLGSGQTEELESLITLLERYLGKKAERRLLPMQPGDVTMTFAGMRAMQELTGWQPTTSLESGLEKFVAWYREYRSA
ncbi:MAG: NAD-dependent epimerase/dehydratase family protein [Burkholderiales bacterium]|nr:NAD-dependent epimerase/dehydratase family protein [Burkholderiales bacterium]